jgi:hypothetical protein
VQRSFGPTCVRVAMVAALAAPAAVAVSPAIGLGGHVSHRPDPAGILHGAPIRGMFLDDRGADPQRVTGDLPRLKAIGVNTIPLYIRLTTTGTNSNTVSVSPAATPEPTLRRLIGLAHKLGLAVNLVPFVEMPGPDYVWRGLLNPSKPGLWFANYQKVLRPYEKLAEKLNVELFTVGSELNALQQPSFRSYWKTLIAQTRSTFKGKLSYQSATGAQAVEKMTWWDLVDLIGVSAYYSLSPKPDPTVASLVKTWTHYYLPALKTTSQKFNRKIFFSEVGYSSNSLTAWKPAVTWDQHIGTISLQAQANAYEALLIATKGLSWYAGTQWFHWGKRQDTNNANYVPRDKPAECVIGKYWAPSRDSKLSDKPGKCYLAHLTARRH